MKSIYIIRHSKAVEHAPDFKDFNRSLAESGKQKARLISQTLAEDIGSIDLIISSPACRALETAEIFAEALHYNPKQIQTAEALYHFGGFDYALEIINSVDNSISSLAIFGHNPTFNALAWHLCDQFREGLPTSAVVGLDLNTRSWGKIKAGRANLRIYLTRRGIEAH